MKSFTTKLNRARMWVTLLAVFMSVGMWALDLHSGDTWDEGTGTLTINSNPGNFYDYHSQPDYVKVRVLVISDAVTDTGAFPFYHFDNVESIIIGNGLKSIASAPFATCNYLTDFTVSAGNENYKSVDGVVFSKDGKTIVVYPGGKTATHYTIPSGVTAIGDDAFMGSLHTIDFTIPDGVTSIGSRAFYWNSLKSIYLPSSVKSIGDQAFEACASLATIEGGDSLEYIGDDAFKNTKWYTDLVASAPGLVYMGNLAYQYVGSMDPNTEIKIKEGTLGIGARCFENFENLKSITLPEGFKTIERNAFQGCTGLTNITFPTSVESIGDDAFFGCTGLTVFTIPASVTYIGGDAFKGCKNLSVLVCFADPDKLTWYDVDYDDFKSDGSTRCHVADKAAFEAKWFNHDYVYDVNVKFVTFDIREFTVDNLKYQIYSSGNATVTGYETGLAGDVVIPETVSYAGYDYNVTAIGGSAFKDCHDMTSITIHDGVTSIGSYAFPGSGLTEITIGKGLTFIGERAFYFLGATNVYCYANSADLTWTSPSEDFLSTDFYVFNTTAWSNAFPDASKVTFKSLCSVIGHDFYAETHVEPTCTEDGLVIRSCDRCGEDVVEVTIPAVGHIFNEDGVCTVCGYDPSKMMTLVDNAVNKDALLLFDALEHIIVTLQGRTLKGGHWNTLCLPFSLTAEQLAVSPLKNATIRTFSDYTNDGTTLTLKFTTVTEMKAGKPYIVWIDGEDIVNPVFEDVEIDTYPRETWVEHSMTDKAHFTGTFNATPIPANDRHYLFLSNDNFYYPTADITMGACRGYLYFINEVPVSPGAKIVIDFSDADDEATEIADVNSEMENAEEWYTVNGVKLDGKPTAKGIYIVNGKKVMIK